MTGEHGCRHTGLSGPSCRHNDCDSKKRALTCGNAGCDGIDVGHGCRHNRSRQPLAEAQSGHVDDAVTHEGARARWAEISTSDDGVTVRVPVDLPTLTPRAARALLVILVELADVPVLDRPGEGTHDDS